MLVKACVEQCKRNVWNVSHTMRKPVYANNKSTDQPAHLCSLIRAFVARLQDSITPLEIEPRHEKAILPYENNKGADQPAHPRSLISAFVVRCLDSIIPLVSKSKISSL